MANNKPNLSQKEAIEAGKGPLLIIAGAGTGKTFVITERIIHLLKKKLAKPSEILALTFTQKAAEEMQTRIDVEMPYGYEPMAISTFHAFADQILRQEASFIGLDGSYKLINSSQAYLLFRKQLFNMKLEYFRPPGNPTKYIRDLLSHFSRLKDEDVTTDDYIKYAKNLEKSLKEVKKDSVQIEEVKKYQELSYAYKTYEDLKRKNSMLDFGDLISELLRLFRTRKTILKKYKDQYRYIFIDEYQDTNYAQNELLYLLSGDEKNITVVGDDDQSIYKFRGAAISNILQFKKHFESKKQKVKSVVLTENHRNFQSILDSAYSLIRFNNPDRLEETEKIDKRLISVLPEKEDKKIERVKILHGKTETDEVDLIVHNILNLVGRSKDSPIKDRNELILKTLDAKKNPIENENGQLGFVGLISEENPQKYEYRDFAILVRANSGADEIIKGFKFFGIPYRFMGPKGLFSQEEIKDIIAFLQLLENYKKDLALVRLLRIPAFEVEVREMIELFQVQKTLRISLFETLEYLLNQKVGTSEKPDKNLAKNPTQSQFAQPEITNIFSENSLNRLKNLLKQFESGFRKIKEGRKLTEIVYYFLNNSGILNHFTEIATGKIDGKEISSSKIAQSEFKIQNISKFFEIVKKFDETAEFAELSNFIEYLQYSIEVGENPDISEKVDQSDRNAVNIVTVHGAKGLEFPVVFMPGLVDQRFPSRDRKDVIPVPDDLIKEILPTGNEHLQEERRLFYVGMTRAKEMLFLSYAEHYSEALRARKPSMFLLESQGGEVKTEITYSRPEGISSIKYLSAEEDNFPLPGEMLRDLGRQISYSQIQTYEKCPLHYKYSYVLRIPTPDNHVLSYGSSIHNTLKAFYTEFNSSRQGLPGVFEMPKLNRLLALFKEKWISKGYESLEQEKIKYDRGRKILTNFYEKFVNENDNPIMLEQRFRLPVYEKSYVVNGFIDRVDELPNGEVEIIDYKTGRVESQADIKKNDQLVIYSNSLEKIFKKKVAKVSLLFVDELQKVSVEPEKARMDMILKKMDEIVKKIRNAEFPPKPGPFTCSMCEYRDICPYAAA